jgi:hypothetical protein
MTSDSSLDPGTWLVKSGLAYWVFELPAQAGIPADRQLVDGLTAIVGVLDGFAEIRSAEWQTREAGEDALIQELDGRGGAEVAAELVAGGSSLRHITSVSLEVDLVCLGPAGRPDRVMGGADLALEWDGDRLEMTFGLNTDIFVARTWADNRDNRALAALNAPRLNSFLHRLQSEIGARLRSFDPSDYVGQYTAAGAVPSS